MPLPKLFLAFCKGIFVYALLFQQIIIREVIDFHGLDVYKRQVYVCALCPGPVDTEFNERADVEMCIRDRAKNVVYLVL